MKCRDCGELIPVTRVRPICDGCRSLRLRVLRAAEKGEISRSDFEHLQRKIRADRRGGAKVAMLKALGEWAEKRPLFEEATP